MSMRCKICSHPKRLEIDKAIVAGQTLRNISQMYGVPVYSVARHGERCLSRQLLTSHRAKELLSAESLLDGIDCQLGDYRRIQDRF